VHGFHEIDKIQNHGLGTQKTQRHRNTEAETTAIEVEKSLWRDEEIVKRDNRTRGGSTETRHTEEQHDETVTWERQ
jgi:hypothetical protein